MVDITVQVDETNNVINVTGEERVINVEVVSFAALAEAVAEAEAAATAAELAEASAEADAASAEADAIATAADRVQTGLDATATAADAVQTGLDRIAAADSAADAAASAASITPSNFLTKAGNLSGLADTATALGNLGVTATAAELNRLQGLPAFTENGLEVVRVNSDETALEFVGVSDVAWPRGNAETFVGDLNTLLSSGTYHYQFASTNKPASSEGVLIVVAKNVPGSFQQISQFAFAGGGTGDIGDVYTRGGRGDPLVWTPWRRVLASDQTGAAPTYGARAWVNFNGTGTVAIRASGNVSSITDNGTGDYTINFATAMPDANYAVVSMCDMSGNTSADAVCIVEDNNVASHRQAGSIRLRAQETEGSTRRDPEFCSLVFFR